MTNLLPWKSPQRTNDRHVMLATLDYKALELVARKERRVLFYGYSLSFLGEGRALSFLEPLFSEAIFWNPRNKSSNPSTVQAIDFDSRKLSVQATTLS
ncbi:hypothetical protein Nepgr_011462 [Nepenthes gracilis]|uniref:Uncharacterized protein n=1 Tax=Nepenthes gracilis TaxID=150966 RepID=A0AAD3SF74_NEPGR|nr:hypothetical protein Nepgr_011462 [Nepenthes gracilis]